MKNRVYILGGSQTDFERNFSKEGKNELALISEVIDDALKDTRLTYDDIISLNKKNKIACFVGNFLSELYCNQGHLAGLLTLINKAFYGVPVIRTEGACASGSLAIDCAMTKISSGDYDVAIVLGWEIMKTVDSKICGDYLGRAAYYDLEAKGIEFPFPKLFGKLANETTKKYNLEERKYLNYLSKISVNNYLNAKRNSNAQTRKWFMNYEQANDRGSSTNPLVGGLLGVSDCSQVTDGAACVVLCSKTYKDAKNIKRCPYIKGYGLRTAPMLFNDKMEEARNSEYVLPWTRQACVDAYKRANLSVDDIDIFETHDCFTSSEYVSISAFSITSPGKEYEAIEDERIFFGGSKPINPSGGLIGCGHPVGASGVRMFLDIFKQVANKAGKYQIKKVRNAMMLNIGGTATTNCVFIIGR